LLERLGRKNKPGKHQVTIRVSACHQQAAWRREQQLPAAATAVSVSVPGTLTQTASCSFVAMKCVQLINLLFMYI
jgi:hypothetical protein